jgi:hypothetical protein
MNGPRGLRLRLARDECVTKRLRLQHAVKSIVDAQRELRRAEREYRLQLARCAPDIQVPIEPVPFLTRPGEQPCKPK